MANRKGRETEEAIARELENWPGATVEFKQGSKHPRAKLSFAGLTQSISFSATPSSPRSLHHSIADVRRTLRALGAEREKAEPSAEDEIASWSPPNDGRAKRPNPVKAEPAPVAPTIRDIFKDLGVEESDQLDLSNLDTKIAGVVMAEQASDPRAADEEAQRARGARGNVLNEKTAVKLARSRPDIDVPLRINVDSNVERSGWGLYTDIPAVDYHLDPCPEPSISNSLMDPLLNKTPRDFAWQHPRRTELVPEWPEEDEEAIEEKKASIRGDVVHQLALGKGKGFQIGDYDSYRTKAAREWREDVIAGGEVPILRGQYEEAEPLADMIVEQIKRALDGADYETEVAFMYQERTPDGWVWVRGLMDVWCPERALILDPKVTERLYDGIVETHAVNMGWDRQAALYPHAIGQIMPELAGRVEFWDLMINPKPPYVSRVWGPERGWDATSVRQCQRAIDKFSECMARKEWPAFGDDPQRGQMPRWEEVRRTEFEEGGR